MRQRLVLYTIGIAFLLTTTGCGATILAYQSSAALDDPELPLGVRRQEVEEKIGKPLSSRALPDGGRVDTYEYVVRDPDWLGQAAMLGLFTAATWGFGEILSTALAVSAVDKNRRTVAFTYAPDDRLLEHGAPPSYGPADDGLRGLSRIDIREGCRSEHPIEGRDMKGGDAKQQVFRSPGLVYRSCIVRRFAIWGIE